MRMLTAKLSQCLERYRYTEWVAISGLSLLLALGPWFLGRLEIAAAMDEYDAPPISTSHAMGSTGTRGGMPPRPVAPITLAIDGLVWDTGDVRAIAAQLLADGKLRTYRETGGQSATEVVIRPKSIEQRFEICELLSATAPVEDCQD